METPQRPSGENATPRGRETFTPKEVSALRQINSNVWTARVVGFVGGCTLMYYGLRRVKQRPGPLGSALFTFFGGFAASLLAIPFGIAMSRNELRSVEDPQHLARALHDALDQRKTPSKILQSASETSATPRDPVEAPASTSDWSTLDVPTAREQPSQESKPGSRWEELRRDRTSPSSVWEQIRQDNARNALPEQNRSSAWSKATDVPPAQSQGLSDYEKAVKEYEAAMERERQGVDVTMGFSENDKVWH
ncbi:hypothetical protein MCAP1_001752 [Malassezia caprae]|uniref:Transmembrane protein n=1 Tax=Malassezia caprae TaxID=1381934 RepID=A0AAF0E815_9BASI|nr:hypothetical protein MCAP1_001752 [Malassezia caprae]